MLDYLRNNKNITMASLERLCKIIGCTPNDIVEFIDIKANEDSMQR
jgi:DNA-binding Xre family transcriptional regulator